ncbi:hypothetical protein ACAF76_014155 [Brevibacillus sp. TJ4]|uniref:hypothetical protein n=1 Tax=Brevibacillus sp. TJ4 TaxID=3234853 RepID=UPI0037D1CC29
MPVSVHIRLAAQWQIVLVFSRSNRSQLGAWFSLAAEQMGILRAICKPGRLFHLLASGIVQAVKPEKAHLPCGEVRFLCDFAISFPAQLLDA